MRSTRYLLAAALFTAPMLISTAAAAGGPSNVPPATGASPIFISISQAILLGINLTPRIEPPLDLGSNVCGDLLVKPSSTCKVLADAGCLSSCDATNFTLSAYNECASSCSAAAGLACKVSCNAPCKELCLGDCDFDPVTSCEDTCEAPCGSLCAGKVASGDLVDAVDCELACLTTCSVKCADASSVAGQNCGVQCGASCGAACTAQANMDCQVDCQVDAFETLGTSCKAGCNAAGSLFCDGEFAGGVVDLEDCIGLLVSLGVTVDQN